MYSSDWNQDPRVAPCSDNYAKSFQATLGNGELGLQGSDSGLEAGRCFMVGVVDLTPSDMQRMALLPTWNSIDLRLPGGPCLAEAFAAGQHRDYGQQLDTSTATLRTRYTIDIGEVAVQVEVETWLSRADRHLGVVRVRLTADRDCELEAQVGITANQTVERHPFRTLAWPHADFPRQYGGGFYDKRMTFAWHPGHMDVVAVDQDATSWGVAAIAAHDGPAVGVAIALGGDFSTVDDAGATGSHVTLQLPAGTTRELVLYAAFRREDRPASLLAGALKAARAARTRGYVALHTEHAAVWADLWGSDLRVEGNDHLDRQVRLDQFMLYQNAPVDQRFPMQIMGLAAPGYYGNVLWDVDCYAWPALLPFAPELAQSTPLFRRRTLDQALQMASKNGYTGAYYPWQASAYAGEDNGPIPEHNRAIHMTFEVAQTMWLQWCALGDRSFLRRDAWPVMAAVADFACSRAEWVPWENRYEFKRVMGVDEPVGIVDNELHTTAMAIRILRQAVRAAEILGLGADPLWSTVAERLYLPTNPHTGLWQQHSACERPSTRRWTETTAYHVAGLAATEDQLRDGLVPLGTGESSTEPEQNLPWNLSFHGLAAARLGDADTFALVLLRQTTIRVDPTTFGLRCEMAGNDAGPYITGCGSLIQALLHGGTGLHWDEDGLVPRFAPCLPTGVERLTFNRLRWHGRNHQVTVDRKNGLRIVARE